jgi:predicted MFS family arabinose efflux permease
MRWLRRSVVEIGRGYAAVLRNDDLRRAQLAWGVAVTAEWIFFVGLSVFVYEEAGTTGVGLVGLIRMVPAAVVAPLASALGDRYRRDRVVLGLFIAMGAAATAAALVALDEPSAAAIYALAAIHNVACTVSRSAQWALMPSLARTPEELVASNGSTLTTQNIGTLAGPAIGGVLLAAASPWALFALAAGCYVGAALYLVPIRMQGTGSKAACDDALRGLLAGFRVVREDGRTRLLVLLIAAQTRCAAP